jgi:hypothetical protein
MARDKLVERTEQGLIGVLLAGSVGILPVERRFQTGLKDRHAQNFLSSVINRRVNHSRQQKTGIPKGRPFALSKT